MSWAYGTVNKRKVGYGVSALCDKKGCKKKINRGIWYCCGEEHGGNEYGCGRYFCGDHLFITANASVCEKCYSSFVVEEVEKWVYEGHPGGCDQECVCGRDKVSAFLNLYVKAEQSRKQQKVVKK